MMLAQARPRLTFCPRLSEQLESLERDVAAEKTLFCSEMA